jgi:hypothetical protein
VTADIRRAPGASLIDVLDRVLDKGIVVDAEMRVSLAGIDLMSVEARMLIASFDTELTHAAAFRSSRQDKYFHCSEKSKDLRSGSPEAHDLKSALPDPSGKRGCRPLNRR